MGKKLEGRIVLITGCSGGIGKDLARKFAQEGAKLAICARSWDKLLVTKSLCEEAGAQVLAVKCDVTKPEELKALVEETAKRYGGIDVLINNAVTANPGTPFLSQTEDDIMGVFNSGFLATWRLMQLCYPHMLGRKARIINFGSPSGIVGTAGYAAYASMKEAIRGLTRTVAREWGRDGITVNAICPTAITENIQAIIDSMPEGKKTPASLGFTIPPVGYVGNAYDHIAPIVVFLASEDSGYLTGQSIRADGGGTLFSA
ncbi:MAG: SDR family oxidoreductase [Pseudoflavonifractor sp.]